ICNFNKSLKQRHQEVKEGASFLKMKSFLCFQMHHTTRARISMKNCGQRRPWHLESSRSQDHDSNGNPHNSSNLSSLPSLFITLLRFPALNGWSRLSTKSEGVFCGRAEKDVREIAPSLLNRVPIRLRKRKTVQQALRDNSWVGDISGSLPAEVI
ncbi:hypothetical protein ACJX0J_017972, partial [Zea mays]